MSRDWDEVLRLDSKNQYALLNLEKLCEEQHQWSDAYTIGQQYAQLAGPDVVGLFVREQVAGFDAVDDPGPVHVAAVGDGADQHGHLDGRDGDLLADAVVGGTFERPHLAVRATARRLSLAGAGGLDSGELTAEVDDARALVETLRSVLAGAGPPVATLSGRDATEGGALRLNLSAGEIRVAGQSVQTLRARAEGTLASHSVEVAARVLNHDIAITGAGQLPRQEPLPADHPFWQADGIIVLPHIGGPHPQRDKFVSKLFAENLARYLDGKPLKEPEGYRETPDEFRMFYDAGMAMGFKHVESAPLVRSSYHAWEQVQAAGV